MCAFTEKRSVATDVTDYRRRARHMIQSDVCRVLRDEVL